MLSYGQSCTQQKKFPKVLIKDLFMVGCSKFNSTDSGENTDMNSVFECSSNQ